MITVLDVPDVITVTDESESDMEVDTEDVVDNNLIIESTIVVKDSKEDGTSDQPNELVIQESTSTDSTCKISQEKLVEPIVNIPVSDSLQKGASKDPIVPINIPVSDSVQKGASKDPIVPIEDPNVLIKDPIVPCQDPIVPIKDPIVPIKDPIVPINQECASAADGITQNDVSSVINHDNSSGDVSPEIYSESVSTDASSSMCNGIIPTAPPVNVKHVDDSSNVADSANNLPSPKELFNTEHLPENVVSSNPVLVINHVSEPVVNMISEKIPENALKLTDDIPSDEEDIALNSKKRRGDFSEFPTKVPRLDEEALTPSTSTEKLIVVEKIPVRNVSEDTFEVDTAISCESMDDTVAISLDSGGEGSAFSQQVLATNMVKSLSICNVTDANQKNCEINSDCENPRNDILPLAISHSTQLLFNSDDDVAIRNELLTNSDDQEQLTFPSVNDSINTAADKIDNTDNIPNEWVNSDLPDDANSPFTDTLLNIVAEHQTPSISLDSGYDKNDSDATDKSEIDSPSLDFINSPPIDITDINEGSPTTPNVESNITTSLPVTKRVTRKGKRGRGRGRARKTSK